MTEQTIIPKEYMIKLQGKDFITHRGLLAIAHDKGLHSIETELITEPTAEIIVFKATAIMSTGVHEKKFTGYGDASKSNVNAMVAPHMLRMAETRAINRALRLATNVGMCSTEELGGNVLPAKEADNPQTGQTSSGVPTGESHTEPEKKGDLHMVCIGCGNNLTENVYKFAMEKHGMSLCYKCQKKKEKGEDYLPKTEEEVIE